MDYSNLIEEAQRYIKSGYKLFPGNVQPLMRCVRSAIQSGLVNSDQCDQLTKLEDQLNNLPLQPPKSFLGSTTVSL